MEFPKVCNTNCVAYFMPLLWTNFAAASLCYNLCHVLFFFLCFCAVPIGPTTQHLWTHFQSVDRKLFHVVFVFCFMFLFLLLFCIIKSALQMSKYSKRRMFGKSKKKKNVELFPFPLQMAFHKNDFQLFHCLLNFVVAVAVTKF